MVLLVGNVYGLKGKFNQGSVQGWETLTYEKEKKDVIFGYIPKVLTKDLEKNEIEFTGSNTVIFKNSDGKEIHRFENIPTTDPAQIDGKIEIKQIRNDENSFNHEFYKNGNGRLDNGKQTYKFIVNGQAHEGDYPKSIIDEMGANADVSKFTLDSSQNIEFPFNNEKRRLKVDGEDYVIDKADSKGQFSEFIRINKNNFKITRLENKKLFEKKDGEMNVEYETDLDGNILNAEINNRRISPNVFNAITNGDPKSLTSINSNPDTDSFIINGKDQLRINPNNPNQFYFKNTLHIDDENKIDIENSKLLEIFDFSVLDRGYNVKETARSGKHFGELIISKKTDKTEQPIEIIIVDGEQPPIKLFDFVNQNANSYTSSTQIVDETVSISKTQHLQRKIKINTEYASPDSKGEKPVTSRTGTYYENGKYVRRVYDLNDENSKKDSYVEFDKNFKPKGVKVGDSIYYRFPDGTTACLKNNAEECKAARKKYDKAVSYASIGDAWSNAIQTAGAARSLLQAFDVKIGAGFLEPLQKILRTEPWASFFAGQPEELLICNKWIKKAGGQGTLIAPFTDFGKIIAPIAAHAQGERTQIVKSCETNANCTQGFTCNGIGICEKNGIQDKEYIYKFTFLIDAQTQNMEAEVKLKGEKTVNLVDRFELDQGSTFSRQGSNAIIERTRTNYNKICINIHAIQGGEFCNEIIDTEAKPILKEIETSSQVTNQNEIRINRLD